MLRHPRCRRPRADLFGAVTLFNVLYALPAQAARLLALAGRARADATLVVFDYVDLGSYRATPIIDAGKRSSRIRRCAMTLAGLLHEGGWQLQSVGDLTEDYARWYAAACRQDRSKARGHRGPGRSGCLRARPRALIPTCSQPSGRAVLGGAVIYGEKLAPVGLAGNAFAAPNSESDDERGDDDDRNHAAMATRCRIARQRLRASTRSSIASCWLSLMRCQLRRVGKVCGSSLMRAL